MSDVGSETGDGTLLTLGQEERDTLGALGDRLLGEDRFAEALHVYRILLAAEKNNSFYYRAYGVCCEQTDQPDEAKEALERAIELDPQDAYALTARAAIRLREGDKTAALEDLEAAGETSDGKHTRLAERIQALMQSAR